MGNPRKAEAAEKVGEFEFRGEKFTVALEYDDYPLSFIEAMEDGAGLSIQARELLGPEQWGRVRALGLNGAGLQELSEAVKGATGVSPPESPASSD